MGAPKGSVEVCPEGRTCFIYSLRDKGHGCILRDMVRTAVQMHCENDYKDCKRWQLKNTGKSVPENLTPQGEYLHKDRNNWKIKCRP